MMVEIWDSFWSGFWRRWNADILTIYLKSGDQIRLDAVTEWKFENRGNEVVTIQITQSPRAKTRLLVKTIDLTQIAAVTRSK